MYSGVQTPPTRVWMQSAHLVGKAADYQDSQSAFTYVYVCECIHVCACACVCIIM